MPGVFRRDYPKYMVVANCLYIKSADIKAEGNGGIDVPDVLINVTSELKQPPLVERTLIDTGQGLSSEKSIFGQRSWQTKI